MISIQQLRDELRDAGLPVADARVVVRQNDRRVDGTTTQHAADQATVEVVWSGEPTIDQLTVADQVIFTHRGDSQSQKDHRKKKLAELVNSDEESAQLLRVFTRLLFESLRPIYQKLGLPMRSLKELQDTLAKLAEEGKGENN